MTFYFTGTGNSLYVAKQLDTELCSIPQVISNEVQTYKSDKIGIVCPVYGHEVPHMVRDFLEKAEFETDYLYVVLTYGRIHGGAAELTDNMLKGFGKQADYINTILMADNFLPAFDMEEQIAIDPEKKVEEHIAAIKTDIDTKKRWISPVTQEDRDWHQSFLARQPKRQPGARMEVYHVTDDCIGCGICTKVCPVGCIKLEGQRAVYTTENCQMCMACVHHCPQMAIQLNMPEKNPKARYHNPNVRLSEIVSANNQGN